MPCVARRARRSAYARPSRRAFSAQRPLEALHVLESLVESRLQELALVVVLVARHYGDVGVARRAAPRRAAATRGGVAAVGAPLAEPHGRRRLRARDPRRWQEC